MWNSGAKEGRAVTGFRSMTGNRTGRRVGAAFLCAAVGAAVLAVTAAAEQPGETREPAANYFRIGTGPVGGTYFPVGGLIADVLTYRPGGKCASGGCGVKDLLAVAQVTQGSVENVISIQSDTLESGLAQADVAYWMYMGEWAFEGRKPANKLRVIANLYTETIQLVARRDAGIKSVRDLRGKRVSLGDKGSGSDLGARVVLGGYGMTERDIIAEHLGPVPAADKLRAGKLDAFFLVSGAPVLAVTELVEETAATENAVTLIPITGLEAARIRNAYPFYSAVVLPGDTYAGIAPTPTLGVSAQWLVSKSIDPELVFKLTQALWSGPARVLLDSGHPEGRNIRIENALKDVSLPLHPGAARYYREAGLLK